METTGRLGLPLLAPGQAQKELLHNEALQLLEIVTAAAVEEPPLNDPPSAPAASSCYLVGSAPSGDWLQYPGHLAAYTSAGWRFLAPVPGMTALMKSSGLFVVYGPQGWETGAVRAQRLLIDGVQVVGPRGAGIGDPAGGINVDAEARAAIGQILVALRDHGLIAPD